MSNDQIVIPIVGKEFPEIVSDQVRHAVHSIKIIVFDWRWYATEPGSPIQKFNQTIIDAHKRGVKIQAISNIPDIVRILKEQGISAKKLATTKLVHAKIMIIDEKNIVIGSHNYTQNAFNINYELSVLIGNCAGAERFVKYFNNLFLANGNS